MLRQDELYIKDNLEIALACSEGKKEVMGIERELLAAAYARKYMTLEKADHIIDFFLYMLKQDDKE